MRIPTSLIYGDTGRLIGRKQRELNDAAQAISTGRRIRQAADDPAGMRQADGLRSGARRIEGYIDNVGRARELLQRSDASLDAVSDILVKARTLALSGANGDKTAEDMAALAEEVDGLRTAVRNEANTRWEGRYIFGGLRDDAPPFDDDDTYRGSDVMMDMEVGPGLKQAVRFDGGVLFKNEQQGADVLGTLAQLSEALRSGVHADVRDTLEPLDAAMAQIGAGRARVGAGLARLEQTESSLEKLSVETEAARARVEDTDVAEKVIELSLDERTLTSAMAVAPRVMNASLVDFLR